MMHGHTYIKFACAKQAKDAHAYKNTKRRVYKTTAAIWFNKTCKINFFIASSWYIFLTYIYDARSHLYQIIIIIIIIIIDSFNSFMA